MQQDSRSKRKLQNEIIDIVDDDSWPKIFEVFNSNNNILQYLHM